MSLQAGTGQGPDLPSTLQIWHKEFSAVETAQPTDRVNGFNVSKWREVVLSVYPVSPDINDAGAVGWQLQIKVWRWKQKSQVGTGRSGGQWFAEQEVTVSMDGDIATGGPMEYQFPTWDSELMYFQATVSNGTPAGAWTACIEVYGLVPRVTSTGETCECEATGGSGTGGAALVVRSLFDLISHQDYTYSNLRGDFDAIRQSATTIDLSRVPFPVEERQILAIGLKTTGATTQTRMWYRDKDLFCDYNSALGRITISGFAIGVTDAVSVWIEGPSKVDDIDNYARRVRVINPDGKLVTEDGNILREMAEQAAVYYVPFNMAEDGLHFLSLHHDCDGDVFVTIEGTNDLDREGQETWDDITQYLTGFVQIDATTPDVIPPQAWCGYRRIRFVLNPGAAGGTVDLFVMRSAYGDLWNPQAYEAEVLQLAGPQIMGEPRSVQAAAMTQGEAGRLVTNLYKEIVNAAFIWATQANRSEEDDPLDTRDVVETPIDVENLADGAWHYIYFQLQHLQHWSIQTIMSDGTATDDLQLMIWASNESGVAPGTIADWSDITNLITGLAAVVNTAGAVNRIDFADTSISADWIRVGYQRTAGAANNADITARIKRWY